MDQSEDLSHFVDGASHFKANVDSTSLAEESTVSVASLDASTRPSDQSGNSSLFLAERTARVNARSRANRVYGASASLDTTANSLLDKSTVSVNSSCNTSTGSSFSLPSHSHQQQLQRRQTSINLTHYHYSDEFSPSLGGGNISIPNTFSTLGEIGSTAYSAHNRAESSMRSSNIDAIRPSTSSFSQFTAPPMTSVLRPRGGRLIRPSSVRSPYPSGSMQSHPTNIVSLLNLPSYAHRFLGDNENVMAAPSAPRTRTISPPVTVRRNSSSDSANTSQESNGSRDAKDCSYCLSVNKYAIGHNKHNCPVLANLPPCRICGATGKDNHTESHCPYQEKTDLEFIPKHRRNTCTF